MLTPDLDIAGAYSPALVIDPSYMSASSRSPFLLLAQTLECNHLVFEQRCLKSRQTINVDSDLVVLKTGEFTTFRARKEELMGPSPSLFTRAPRRAL